MSIYTNHQQKNIIITILVVIGILLVYSLKDIFTAILGATVLYTILRPAYLHMILKWKWRRAISTLLIIVLSFVVMILPFFALSRMVVSKIKYYNENSHQISELIEKLSKITHIDFKKSEMIETAIHNIENWALGAFPSVISAVLGTFAIITIMYFLLYFMFVEYDKFEKAIKKYMPFKSDNTLLFADELKNITYSNVLGQTLIAIAQGSFIALGFVIFGFQDPIFWGTITAILSFIPIIGAPIIFVPAGLIALSNGDTIGGIGIMIWGFVLVVNIDNLLRLVIAKKIGDIHPIITIIGVIIGIPTFGILGLVFGPLLISYFLLLFTIYEKKYGIVHEDEAISKESAKNNEDDIREQS